MKRIHNAQNLDDIDLILINQLQADSRMTNSRLAHAAGIAESTCVVRVRALVSRGIITRFTAQVNPKALGLGLQALISVNIRPGARTQIPAFRDEIRVMPHVLQVFFLGGAEDFIIHLMARDSDDVRDFVLENLSANPAVASTRTSMVFEHHYNGAHAD
ncbi:Lrp/AsnC family transcriptional regulator [Glaciibacter psychrotolerans]|uniref:DNA-binding Lrp family transcriptional regulator n=1 Tax=Glaciibacter psychrotolerans TaxID=670054 RepID=A0A7Z0EGY5_9MICO|nr:DNA-binding Lrp family transcriptional regulator [Leifsonia psychrotolerans]